MKIIYRILLCTIILPLAFTSCRQDNANHHFKNGSAKFQLKDYNGAINDFSRAIALNTNYKEAYYARAISYGILAKYDKALEDFNKVLQLDPTFKDAYMNRAYYAKEKTGDFKGALEDLNKFIDLNKDGNNAFALNNRGFIKFSLNDHAGAMEDIQKSIELDPNNSFAYKNRALIYISTDSINLACTDLNKALELGFTKDYGNEVIELSDKYCKQN
jgi:tetratricopeptide (TPR) repeat protein